ncbi:malto-oligosyltrehalose trehalohydrolase [Xenophilus sp. Marseille-Q4582]|uniref:malto-oligosyltrehalose trehalohydrolase n=1 Tax=Xenophilus sp. Marseille-Q4582 TaxID=2866600 RepID=UPI001CE45D9E|nr:malto-oligosyltrehalose trehalohydrolase [Xenophilus sp. Marseille-Q4582]
MSPSHDMPFGTTPLPTGGTRFRLWAPAADPVHLEWRHPDTADWTRLPMQAEAPGRYIAEVPGAGPGDLYRFALPDGLTVPDPASRRNPHDVHGPSEVTDPDAFVWTDQRWRGRPWEEAVVYELHVGTFTSEGSFDAARLRLPELVELGITAVELMPVAEFPGARGWGYDGVLPFAPEASYGTPESLKALVNAAHELGLMVLLDVVYNHFGPEGNYLHAYCPAFFNPAHQTPWGAAINFDGEGAADVRAFFVHNALYWVEEFHFDGLRLDAVHAIRDDSARHIVAEICEALQRGPGRARQVHVVLENDLNQARLLERDAQRRPRLATAQWNDDLHHAAHVSLTGEQDGYYLDYAQQPLAGLGRAFAGGYVYRGQPSPFREGEARGEPTDHLPCGAFVSYLQTHDQIGNRAFGDRIDALADPARVRGLRLALLLSPHAPLLFMGEEWASVTPFQFFCDFGPDLAQAVSGGRRAEFGHFAAFKDEAARARIPDPNDAATFEASRLDREERDRASHAQALYEVRQALALRQREIVPHLPSRPGSGRWHVEGTLLYLQWTLDAGKAGPGRRGRGGGPRAALLQMVINLGLEDARAARPPGRVIHRHGVQPQHPGQERSALLLAPGGLCVALQEEGRDA